MEFTNEINKQDFENWLTNPSVSKLNDAFGYLSTILINPIYDSHLNETNVLVEKFLLSLDELIGDGQLNSENIPLVFGILSSLIVEIGQYRYETTNIDMSYMVKMREKTAILMKNLLSHYVFDKINEDINEEIFPLIESCIDRFFPYRVSRICSIAERLYEISERTSDDEIKVLLGILYHKKYPRFGTSGVRGIWGRDITERQVEAVVQAICDSIKADDTINGKSIVIGYDSRLHADTLAYWVASVCLANGFQIYMTKRDTPTPVINYWAIEKLNQEVAGVIVCTASHNPSEWQGVKYILHNGMQAPTSVTDWIGSKANQLLILKKPIRTIKDFEKAKYNGKFKMFEPLDDYCNWVLSKPSDTGLRVELIRDWMQDKLVIIDEMHGAGRDYLRNILTKIGVPFVVVHGQKDAMFGNLEYANPEEPHVADCQYMVRSFGAFLGLAMDADADRFGAIDYDGTYFTANQLIAMLAEYLLKQRGMQGKVIHSFTCFPYIHETITSFNTDNKLSSPNSSVIPAYITHPFYVVKHGNPKQITGISTYITMVGMKYLAEAMMMNPNYQLEDNPKIRESMIIAGEESGGLTTKGHIPDKDGLWADMLILEMVSFYKKPLKEIWSDLVNRLQNEQYSGRLDVDGTEEAKDMLVKFYLYDFPKSEKQIGGLDCIYIGGILNDFVELHFENAEVKGRLIIRASGTEPICRIYSECTLESKRKEIEYEVLKKFEDISFEQIRKTHNIGHLIDVLIVTPPLPKIISSTKEKIKQFSINGSDSVDIVYEKLQKKACLLDTRRKLMAELWLQIIK